MADSNDILDALVNGYYPYLNKRYTLSYMTLNPNDKYVENIDRIICNPPATIIIWENGDKSIVKCMDTDTYNPEQGIAMCLLKQMLSDDGYRKLKKIMQEKSEDFIWYEDEK